MRVTRRGFLASTAGAAGATLALGACGSSSGDSCGPGSPGPCTSGLPDGAYFDQLAQDLAAAGFGTPQIVIDLDRLDANADAIAAGAGVDRYRIVEKSLPSLDLLSYVSARTGSDRFLVLHLPFLPTILGAFPTAHVLVGKPQPIAAVVKFLQAVSPADAQRVAFLADTPQRATELAQLGLPLQVGVEIDVGLHRGGVPAPASLGDVLAVIAAGPVTFAGMLGYDGHVANAPAAPGLEEYTARQQWKTATARYQAFVDAGSTQFPSLWRDDLIFNSGSTATYPLYTSGPVNDVAAGGGMLRPASYPSTFLGALAPASFIAAPVLAHYDSVDLPLIKNVSKTVWDDQQMFTIYGGGWAAEFAWPPGIDLAPLVNDPENENLVPNQTWLVGPKSPPILPDDWIFQHPRVADAIFQFEEILLVRDGRLQPTTWKAFPRRY
jgi:D-serine deaminase-like pyridoxal phosphate-dependent protein